MRPSSMRAQAESSVCLEKLGFRQETCAIVDDLDGNLYFGATIKLGGWSERKWLMLVSDSVFPREI